MDDAQRIVKCGHLSLHSAGGFFKKRWHNKYLVLYDGSKSGVKRLELFDSEIKFKKQNPERIIPLVDCVRVVTCQRQKSTYTFEVRTSDQFYLLAAQSFQAMNDWVNCLRLVAFGQQQQQASSGPTATQTASGHLSQLTTGPNSSISAESASVNKPNLSQTVEQTKLGERRQLLHAHTATDQSGATSAGGPQPAGAGLTTASQAAAAAASALAKTRQRQPSLLGSCKPQPPGDSPFISGLSVATPTRGSNAGALATSSSSSSLLNCSSTFGQLDTMTPTVRGQLISTKNGLIAAVAAASPQLAATTPPPKGSHNQMVVAKPSDSCNQAAAPVDQIGQQQVNSKFNQSHRQQPPAGAATMQILNEEEEENMLYCSIEDNPSEHNYRVKVIETELALRCQLKCYQLIEPTLISEQYEELAQFRHQNTSSKLSIAANNKQQQQPSHCIVTFYQLIIGPQELTLLNDYATSGSRQQGLWSWPYQCIRRYGFDKDNCFMFEAGRKCTSGPGQFIVQTPKAYSIYQDIVKFVNELRTINGTQATNPALSFGQQKQPLIDIDNHQAPVQQKQLVVTQIPVVWAPNKHLQQQQVVATGSGQQTVMCQDELPAGDGEHRKRQFFDALRQSMDSSASCLGANITTTTTSGTGANNEADNLQVQVQVASSDGLDNLQAININGAIKQQQAATETSATATKVLDTTSNRPPGHELAVAGRRSLANSSSTATTTTATNISGTQDNGSADVASNPMIHESKSSLLGAAKLVQAQRLRKLDDNHNNNTQAPDSIKKQSILLGPLTAVGASQASSKILAASKSTAIGHNNISSSDHDTDESGYEQGDESVDSCSTSLVKTKKAPSSPTSSSTSEPIVVVGRKRQLASDSMSSASSTSSEAMQTSPIQSVSRRTTGGLGPISTAAATTTTTVGGPGSRFSSAPSTNVGQGPAKRPPISNSIRSVATIASNIEKRQQQSKQHLFNGLRTSHTATAGGDGGGLLDDGRQRPFDFEANLIRDVYSEISKLHAKFAVTSSGSADDSMSSGSSRESASSDQIDQGADETDDRRLDGNDDNEPMYSNLESRVSGIDDLRRRVMNSNRREREQENDELIGDSKGASRTASSRLNASRQQSINHKAQQQATQNGIQQQAQRSQTHQHNNNNHPHHHNHSQQQQHHHQSNLSQVNTNNLGRIGGNLLDMSYLSQSSIAPPLSSSSMRQLYPTILNPIPECGELAHQPPPVAPKPSKGSLNDIPSSPNTSSRTTNELRLGGVARSQQATSRTSQPPEFGAVIEKGLPRAQLVPSRNLANITNNNGTNQLQQSSSKNRQTTNKLKPTNHYVINDVQYAKISRNLRY